MSVRTTHPHRWTCMRRTKHRTLTSSGKSPCRAPNPRVFHVATLSSCLHWAWRCSRVARIFRAVKAAQRRLLCCVLFTCCCVRLRARRRCRNARLLAPVCLAARYAASFLAFWRRSLLSLDFPAISQKVTQYLYSVDLSRRQRIKRFG